MEEELINDLTAELEITDKNFNPTLLSVKVKTAIRDVKKARRYPESYSSDMVETDLSNFYSQCRAIALNDYNKVGMDFETQRSENGTSIHFTDRDKLFAGIVPLAKV